MCDFTAGLWAAFGAVTGDARQAAATRMTAAIEIDLALYETMIPFLKDMPMRFRHHGTVAERTGNTPDYVSPGGAYQAGDGEWIFISGTGDRVFTRLMNAVGRPDMAEMPMFQHNRDRVTNRPRWMSAINEWLQAAHDGGGAGSICARRSAGDEDPEHRRRDDPSAGGGARQLRRRAGPRPWRGVRDRAGAAPRADAGDASASPARISASRLRTCCRAS